MVKSFLSLINSGLPFLGSANPTPIYRPLHSESTSSSVVSPPSPEVTARAEHHIVNSKTIALRKRRNFLLQWGKKAGPSKENPDLVELRTQRLHAVETLIEENQNLFLNTAIVHFEELKTRINSTQPKEKSFKKFERELVGFLAQHLLPESQKNKKKILAEAKNRYKHAVVDALNRQEWNAFETRFFHKEHFYVSNMTPAAQLKLGDNNLSTDIDFAAPAGKSIFKVDYDNKGIASGTTKCTEHATNLWISKFSARAPHRADDKEHEEVLFQGVRHGILSPYGLKRGSKERREGALNRAKEIVTAALFIQQEKLREALRTGDPVDIFLTSTSLVNAFNLGKMTEGKQIEEQFEAWNTLSRQKPFPLEIHDEKGELRTIQVNLEVAAFNFGVTEMALKLKRGWEKSDTQNAKGLQTILGSKENMQSLQQLLGTDLQADDAFGGWVGRYLSNNPSAADAQIVRDLCRQINEIWNAKKHRDDAGDPYKMARLIVLLSHRIGVVPCYNCKSGKDRTGMLDSEIKREVTALHCDGSHSNYKTQLNQEQKKLFQKVLLHSGNLEIQKKNTGAPGNIVLRNFPPLKKLIYPKLSLKERIGDNEVFHRARGLSGVVKA